jgi:hypothetical protein
MFPCSLAGSVVSGVVRKIKSGDDRWRIGKQLEYGADGAPEAERENNAERDRERGLGRYHGTTPSATLVQDASARRALRSLSRFFAAHALEQQKPTPLACHQGDARKLLPHCAQNASTFLDGLPIVISFVKLTLTKAGAPLDAPADARVRK